MIKLYNRGYEFMSIIFSILVLFPTIKLTRVTQAIQTVSTHVEFYLPISRVT